ncbi:hypothetical protein A6X21_21465 [Planctopirus hydrillae]|uniref:Uncharacterized protein n=1 Tax=Planctopirus hydrillae TaxID=1841610 RepID=A0A1C3EFR6_9PLAN|nr:hypothetical protein A6X21_21465 [Planctopirus hydrillae]
MPDDSFVIFRCETLTAGACVPRSLVNQSERNGVWKFCKVRRFSSWWALSWQFFLADRQFIWQILLMSSTRAS